MFIGPPLSIYYVKKKRFFVSFPSFVRKCSFYKKATLTRYFNIILGKSELVTTTEAAFDQIYDINERDVVIGISYARYTKSTLNAVSYAAEKNATIIALTDHLSSPITSYANISLFASSHMQSFLDSFVAPLSIINTLIAYIGNEANIDMKKRLEEFEQLWDRYDVFYKNKD